jgi:hypothetical protein
MGEAKNTRFGEKEWACDAPGIGAREAEVEGARWMIARYAVEGEIDHPDTRA